jgi:transcriptional regulator with XRE-family HTH domain
MNARGVHSTDKHVGGRVRMRRLMVGISQGRLGDALGVSFQQVQKYEKGTNRISASRLQQIADILEAPISFFFEGIPAPDAKGGPETGSYVNDFLATTEGLALARAFTKINKPQLRQCIVAVVEQIADRQ